MDSLLRKARRAAAALALVAGLPVAAPAQLIPLKSVPIATGDQFLFYPSQNLGMAGVSIALDDPWGDPFVNPAKGARLRGSTLFTSPTFYSISGDNGAGRTLPVAAVLGSDDWFGGFSLSLQQLEAPEQPGFLFIPEGARPLSQRSSNNMYAFGLFGRRLPGSRFALGASAAWADLDAVGGVELLYAGSQGVEQFGHSLDLRLGLLGEWGDGRSFEALLLHHRFRMTHDVTYVEFVWDTVTWQIVQNRRLEKNLDRTHTWGLHLGYVQPRTAEGWRIGGILTVNRKSHPKIPNYEIANIPRDPGDSWAFRIGTGVARSAGPATYGVDVVYEPIWSHTWAEAADSITTPDSVVIPPGGKTVDNDFRFSNAWLRIGVRWEDEPVGFQLGLGVRSIRYTLKQRDFVADSLREQDEAWMEWTPSWGASLRLRGLEVRYAGRLTTGTGRPGIAWVPIPLRGEALLASGDFIVAPSGPLSLQDEDVVTHQVSLAVPH